MSLETRLAKNSPFKQPIFSPGLVNSLIVSSHLKPEGKVLFNVSWKNRLKTCNEVETSKTFLVLLLLFSKVWGFHFLESERFLRNSFRSAMNDSKCGLDLRPTCERSRWLKKGDTLKRRLQKSERKTTKRLPRQL